MGTKKPSLLISLKWNFAFRSLCPRQTEFSIEQNGGK
jgi:hypothetical protein